MFFFFSSLGLVVQEHVRTSGFLASDPNTLMKYLYDDAKTTYESFLRGLKVSSMYWLELLTITSLDFHKALVQVHAKMFIPTA